MNYMVRVSRQCEGLRIDHLTPLLVVTMPYVCWFSWRGDYIEDFKWCLHFQYGVVFSRVILREVYFEGLNCVWKALNIGSQAWTTVHPHPCGPVNGPYVVAGTVDFHRWSTQAHMEASVNLCDDCRYEVCRHQDNRTKQVLGNTVAWEYDWC